MGDKVRILDSRKMTLDSQNSEVINNESRDASPSKKSDSSPREILPASENLLTLQTSGAPSMADEKLESPNYSGGKKYPEEKGAFAIWDSPVKTQEPPMSKASPEEHVQETSPDKHEVGPVTVASRGNKDGSKKPLYQSIFDLFRNAKPAKSEKAHLLDTDGSSTSSEEESECKQSQPITLYKPLLNTDLIGQREGFLPGPLSVAEDDLGTNIAEMTSISLGSKKCLPSNPGSRVISPEGSTGDVSIHEREFEEVSSPSECCEQDLERTKIQNASSVTENEVKRRLKVLWDSVRFSEN